MRWFSVFLLEFHFFSKDCVPPPWIKILVIFTHIKWKVNPWQLAVRFSGLEKCENRFVFTFWTKHISNIICLVVHAQIEQLTFCIFRRLIQNIFRTILFHITNSIFWQRNCVFHLFLWACLRAPLSWKKINKWPRFRFLKTVKGFRINLWPSGNSHFFLLQLSLNQYASPITFVGSSSNVMPAFTKMILRSVKTRSLQKLHYSWWFSILTFSAQVFLTMKVTISLEET